MNTDGHIGIARRILAQRAFPGSGIKCPGAVESQGFPTERRIASAAAEFHRAVTDGRVEGRVHAGAHGRVADGDIAAPELVLSERAGPDGNVPTPAGSLTQCVIADGHVPGALEKPVQGKGADSRVEAAYIRIQGVGADGRVVDVVGHGAQGPGADGRVEFAGGTLEYWHATSNQLLFQKNVDIYINIVRYNIAKLLNK